MHVYNCDNTAIKGDNHAGVIIFSWTQLLKAVKQMVQRLIAIITKYCYIFLYVALFLSPKRYFTELHNIVVELSYFLLYCTVLIIFYYALVNKEYHYCLTTTELDRTNHAHHFIFSFTF